MAALTDLGVVEAAAAIANRDVTAAEVTRACLDRIEKTDGQHSHHGDPTSINAWVRVYADDALRAAEAADRLVASGAELPPLLGVPVGLKDLYAVAGKPLTASSGVFEDVPTESSAMWQQLESAGMILLGHLHTHEFAAGGTTDQVGNPWDLTRSAGGSSGGSAAALAARMVPAATGTDTAGSLRIPSACCGTSTIKPTRGVLSTRGIVPLSWTLDHPGPMGRSLTDCKALYAALVGAPNTLSTAPTGARLTGSTLAISPQLSVVGLDADVADGFARAVDACRNAGATVIDVPPPDVGFDVGDAFLDVMTTDMLGYHQRFSDRRDLYRPSLREWLEMGDARAVSGARYASLQAERLELTHAWSAWLDEHRIDAVISPTIAVVAPLRGDGYQHAGSDYDMISLTSFWDWTGFPAVAMPSALGATTGLPVGVSLIGATGSDWRLLDLGIELQAQLGVPTWPATTAD